MEKIIELKIPDLGDAEETEIIEIAVKKGDAVKENDPMIVLESEKAAMEVPADFGGKIVELKVKEGDTVTQGQVYAVIEAETEIPEKEDITETKTEKIREQTNNKTTLIENKPQLHLAVNAGPAVRKFSREFNIDLGKIKGTGKNGMITRKDFKSYIESLKSGSTPKYNDLRDLEKYGEYQLVKQNKIGVISAKNLSTSWSSIPHVTHFETADITSAEENRSKLNANSDIKITPLSYILKAVSLALLEKSKSSPDIMSSFPLILNLTLLVL